MFIESATRLTPKLEPTNGLVDVLVSDQIERPTAD
jgi:hypothetical protein